MHHHLTIWLLVLLVLLQKVQGDQPLAEDCFDYCLKCVGDLENYKTPDVILRGPLEVSLQAAANGTLPTAQIVLLESIPSTNILVSHEKVTLMFGQKTKHLSLASPHTAFSWTTLVLDPSGPDTLRVYTPTNRLNVIIANINRISLAFVSSRHETHVAFNCLSGCLIHNSSSALVDRKVKLQPPFTIYLNPRPRPLPAPFVHSVTPVLTLASDQGGNRTVKASNWTPNMWYRVEILETENEQKQTQMEPQMGSDGVMEVKIWVSKSNYTPTRLKGFRWTLHCAPEGLIDTFTSTDSRINTEEGTWTSTPPSETGEGTVAAEGGSEGDKSKQKTGGAGAGMVTAWVMVGLALFLVMVLALALCSKTARPSNANQFHDSQPSVGIVYCRGGNREPEEDSEPESPHELKVPSYRNSVKQFGNDFKIAEG